MLALSLVLNVVPSVPLLCGVPGREKHEFIRLALAPVISAFSVHVSVYIM